MPALVAVPGRGLLLVHHVDLFLADGEAAFQEVFHVHLHVFPRFRGDPFRIEADWRVRERHLLDETAAAVRSGITALEAAGGVGPPGVLEQP
ncbi:HIT domain-containing protein [Streptomyces sp. SA15]|uniref:HIT family protein n=1 Tax=Streptomyces sp. SA15 TaxID=934019 RepID=UPI00211C3A6C|nr:HIT domain-containing protein [Streptomyces sp. SA15]